MLSSSQPELAHVLQELVVVVMLGLYAARSALCAISAK